MVGDVVEEIGYHLQYTLLLLIRCDAVITKSFNLKFTIHFATINTLLDNHSEEFPAYLQYTLLLLIP